MKRDLEVLDCLVLPKSLQGITAGARYINLKHVQALIAVTSANAGASEPCKSNVINKLGLGSAKYNLCILPPLYPPETPPHTTFSLFLEETFIFTELKYHGCSFPSLYVTADAIHFSLAAGAKQEQAQNRQMGAQTVASRF